MSPKRLWLGEPPNNPTLDHLVWRRPSEGPSSLHSNIDPDLTQLGAVAPANRDAVWLAATVFLADRTARRRKGWERDLRIAVPVSDPAAWGAVCRDVEALLSFLTSDVWDIDFLPDPIRGPCPGSGLDVGADGTNPQARSEVDLVCLFSGGADSMCGTVRALADNRRVTLMSHWDWTGHASTQSCLVGELCNLFNVNLEHVQVNLGRSRKQIGGTTFPDEVTRRSRGLLFVALGLAVASVGPPAPMWIPENGFASLSPPLTPERRASLSTRTTHPAFLDRLQVTLRAVDAHADFSNPFMGATKGEMFADVASIIGDHEAARLLSKTHSCSHIRWAGMFGRPPDTHCGLCFGCLVRRGAFVASGLEDRTTYLASDLSESERSRFLTSSVRADVEAVRYAVNREFGPADVLAMDLPDAYDPQGALDLIRRGFSELAAVRPP